LDDAPVFFRGQAVDSSLGLLNSAHTRSQSPSGIELLVLVPIRKNLRPSALARMCPVVLGRTDPHWEQDREERRGSRRYHPRRRRAGGFLIIRAEGA
jgi:hypothetical protein